MVNSVLGSRCNKNLYKPLSMLENELIVIKKAKSGDHEAFTALYNHYVDQIFRFVLIKTGSHHDAEDLTHETFLKAWQHLPNFNDLGHPFSAWLYEIARNKVIDRYRAKKDSISLEPEFAASLVSDENVSDQVSLNFEVAKIRLAMTELSELEQEIVTMRFINDLSPAKIAESLDKSEGMIRITQHRAIRKLKKILDNESDF